MKTFAVGVIQSSESLRAMVATTIICAEVARARITLRLERAPVCRRPDARSLAVPPREARPDGVLTIVDDVHLEVLHDFARP